MFVLAAVILGLIIGKVRGGKVSAIRLKDIHLWVLGLVGAVLQIGLHVFYYFGTAPSYLMIVNFVSYILILLMFIFNFNDIWTILMTIGVTANFIGAFINGGKMPVADAIVQALGNDQMIRLIGNGGHAVYATLTASSTLWVLGIVLPIPIPNIGRFFALYGGVPGISVGSILALVGAVGWIQYAMNRGKADEEADFLDDSNVGKEDYIVAPDEMENFVPREESRYKTGPLDWLNDESGSLFTMADDAPVKKPDKRENLKEARQPDSDDSPVPDKTVALPDLSPELLEQIRNHGKKFNIGSFGNKRKDDNLEDTRVFTTLKDLGTYDTKPLPTIDSAPQDKALTEEETFAEDGFFTRSFYKQGETAETSENEPTETVPTDHEEDDTADAMNMEDTTETLKETTNTEVESVMPENNKNKEKKQTVVPERQTSSPWASVKKPKAEKRKNREQKINPYRKYSAEQAASQIDISQEDEKQMLNVWHQVSEETKALRNRGKRTTPDWNQTDDPFEASEKSRQKLKQSHTRAARQNHYPEEAAAGRVTNNRQRQASAKAAAAGNVNPADLSSDEEREKAGFKKVEMKVGDKNFSYWRKKKDD